MKRRDFLRCVPALLASNGWAASDYAEVRSGTVLRFPFDHGAHPAFRSEWWYVTGWVTDASGVELGVQITFFRHRPRLQEDNPSAFAPTQLLFAHAALADPRIGRLRHDQRAARQGFDLARAREGVTDVWIDDWSLRQTQSGYAARIEAAEFSLALDFVAAQPMLLQGVAGYSRKGPHPRQASHYYSRPHLGVSGSITLNGKRLSVSGEAWLDHEWSSEYLAEQASGWDWIGINLADGGALMAFRLRNKADGARYWAGGAWRDAGGSVRNFLPEEVRFAPLRQWRSPRSQAIYPVAMRVEVPGLIVELEPLMNDQELDARASTGTIYWEGAVRARQGTAHIGGGYLELTGYAGKLRL